MSSFLFHRRGQTVMEMVVALGILTTGFLGIVTLLNNSLGLHRVVADNYKATYLASEGIELVRNIITENVENGSLWCAGLPAGSYEIDHTLTTAPGYDCGIPYPRLLTFSGQPLFLHSDTHLYDYDSLSATESPFTRMVKISYENYIEANDKMIVQSVVRWRDKTGDNEVNLIDYFFNPLPTVATST